MSMVRESLYSIETLAVVLLGSALVLFITLYRGARLTPEAWYAGENVLSIFFAPLCVILSAGGLGVAVEAAQHLSSGQTGMNLLLTPAVLAVLFAAVAWLLFRATPRNALAARAPGADVVAMTPPVPQPPVRPVPTRRAA